MGMIWAWISNYVPLQLFMSHGYHNVSNHQQLNCFFNRSFRRTSKNTSKLHVTDLWEGNSQVTSRFPHRGTVMRKMFPFDDVIMKLDFITYPCLKFLYNTVPNVVINGWIAFVKLRFCISTFFRTSDITLLLKHWSYVTYPCANVLSWVTK